MSDNIPFDIQMEIIKKVSNVKSLIRFRSVSKPWKSFIDSSDFIKGYGTRYTQPHSCILMYKFDYRSKEKYICLVEDDIETFKVQQELAPSVVSHLLKQYRVIKVVDECHGLMCLFCNDKSNYENKVVIWNPSIRKSVGIIVLPKYGPPIDFHIVYGFGVYPVTRDPTVVKIKHRIGMPWHVEFFTLSSRVWNVIPSSNLPHESISFMSSPVVIDRFIYWAASDMTVGHAKYIVVSFDLIIKEFKVVDLPDSLKNELNGALVFICKLRESLVVYGSIYVDGAKCCSVWVMEHDSSFRKLFTIGACVNKILGSSKSGKTILETPKKFLNDISTVVVYNPCSQQIKNLGISGVERSFFMGSYKESLLLLDHSDLLTHLDDN